MRDDRAQFGDQFVGEHGDGLRVVPVGGVLPGELEAPAPDPADDVEQVRPVGRGAQVPVEPGGRTPHQPAAPGRPVVELAEVVEAHLGVLGQPGNVGEVAQGAVADAPTRHRPQLFLDRLEQHPGVCVGRDVQSDREQGGEPTDRAGQVHAVEQVLPAVPLQVHHHPVAVAPPGQHPTQRGQQHIVDLGPVHAGHILQERARLVGAEPDGHRPGRRDGVRTVPVHRQPATLGNCRPVRNLPGEATLLRVLDQPPRPLLERGRLGAQRDRLAGHRLPVRGVQILQQDPPGRSVHHQMVRRQPQHPVGTEQHRPHQRPGRQIELRDPAVGRPVHNGQHIRRLHRLPGLPPPGFHPVVPHP